MGGYQVGGAVSETSFIPDRKSVSVLHGGNASCRGKIRKERDWDNGKKIQKEGKGKERKRKEGCG